MGQFSGDLVTMPLGDIVLWLANRKPTGVMTLERGRIHKEFVIDQGAAVRASSNDPREYFGQFMVHFGLLTEDQLQRAFETQKETKVLLGRILVMIGIVSEDRVVQTLQIKIRESMLDAFRWKVGTFRFEDTPSQEQRPEIQVSVPLLDIHREAIARSQMWDHYHRIFPDPSHALRIIDNRVPSGATPDTLDGRVISLARHGMSIEAITLELHATDYQVAARLAELHRIGAIEPREPSGFFVEELTNPEGNLRHADLAKKALELKNFSKAIRHVHASDQVDPPNPEVAALSQEVVAQLSEQIESEIARDAVPKLAIRLDASVAKRMTAKQRYIVARIDGKRSIEAIMAVSPMNDFEALEILRQFEREKIITF